jgi:hypothetical protein
MDSAAGHLDGTFFGEYHGDLLIRPTPASQRLYKFSVRLKAGARGLAWQFVQNFFQVGVHVRDPETSLNYRTPSEIFLMTT